MTEMLIALLAVVVIAAVVYAATRRRPSAAGATPLTPSVAGEIEIVLPLDDADPHDPATKRLVGDAARNAFARSREVTAVVVSARGGRFLERIVRPEPPAPTPFVDVPTALSEPHAPRHAGPREPAGAEHAVHGPSFVRFGDAEPPPHPTLAEHLELPDDVRQRIANEQDAVDVVRAIVSASASPVDVDGDVFRRGDEVLIVLHTPIHMSVEPDALNAAFVCFQRTGARRGAVLTAGTMHIADVRRREALAPQLLHAGPDGIQRMADAVAVGADPFDFVLPAA
jgi:hypothetical protein